MLEQWLKSGFVDKGLFYDTDEGTPQGGIISPTLMLMTLSGLEQRIKSTALKKGARANFIGYADDFVVTCASKEVLENDIKPLIADFLYGLSAVVNQISLVKHVRCVLIYGLQ